MTSDTCGPTSGTPFASYDHASRSWRTSEATSLWALTLSSLTLPTWGCLHDGELSELPTPEPPTVAPDCSSSLLKTPHAGLGERGRDGVYPNPRGQQDLQHQIATDLLPTPRTSDTNGSGAHGDGELDLRTAITLLPTPTVMDMGANYTPQEWEEWKARQRASHRNGNGHGASLTQEALSLLPTPTAQAAKHGETPDVNANGYGSNLWDLPTLLPSTGAATPPPSSDGSDSPDPHPHLPFPAPTGDHDSRPDSSSG